MKNLLGIAGVLGLALGSPTAQAAHLYAAVEGAIEVYQVAANGSLTLRQTVPSGPVIAMATTPGGRFLYTTDGRWVFHYAAMDNGTIQQWSAPVTACDPEGTGDLGMHPTGDYLYTISSSMCAYRTDDADGRLTLQARMHIVTDGFHMAVRPDGRAIAVLGGEGAAVVPVETNPDGTVGQRREAFVEEWVTGAIAADGRFFYAGFAPDLSLSTSGTVRVLALQPGGVLKVVGALSVGLLPRTGRQRLLALGGTFLAVSAGGPGSRLDIYAVSPDGALRLAASAPIEVYAMATRKGMWGFSSLWVATDDGIVTYSLGADGRLTRIGKTMVTGATVLSFGTK